MRLTEEKTAKTHGKLIIAASTLLAVTFFAEDSASYEILGVSFAPENAQLVLSLVVCAFFAMWLHEIILDDSVQGAKDAIAKHQHRLDVGLPRELGRIIAHQDSWQILDYSKKYVEETSWQVSSKMGDPLQITEETFDFIHTHKNKYLKINDLNNKIPYNPSSLPSDKDIKLRQELMAEMQAIFSELHNSFHGTPYKEKEKRDLKYKIRSFHLGYYTHNTLAVISVLFALCILLREPLNYLLAPDIRF